MKKRIKKIVRQPSTIKDSFLALIITGGIIGVYILIYCLFGKSKTLDTNLTAFFGAILAFSGLMTKQYLFKETIDYFVKWIQIEKILEELITNTDESHQFKDIKTDLIEQKKLSTAYALYIRRELRIIPKIPILLVAFYGAALLACDSILFRSICLGLMLFMVSYLAIATVSSNNLAIEKTEVDQLLLELKEIKSNPTNNKPSL